jgi:hypothetical protein
VRIYGSPWVVCLVSSLLRPQWMTQHPEWESSVMSAPLISCFWSPWVGHAPALQVWFRQRRDLLKQAQKIVNDALSRGIERGRDREIRARRTYAAVLYLVGPRPVRPLACLQRHLEVMQTLGADMLNKRVRGSVGGGEGTRWLKEERDRGEKVMCTLVFNE